MGVTMVNIMHLPGDIKEWFYGENEQKASFPEIIAEKMLASMFVLQFAYPGIVIAIKEINSYIAADLLQPSINFLLNSFDNLKNHKFVDHGHRINYA